MASIGKIIGVNGNLIRVKFETAVSQNEVAYAKLTQKNKDGKSEVIPLKSEVIRIRGDYAELQVFEDTTGLKTGDEVEFTGELLSVELGPGLLTQVFDGLQNPLPKLAEECGFFLQRGKYLKALPRDVKWAFTPVAKAGDVVVAGDTLGTVPEGVFTHRIMVPFKLLGKWTVDYVTSAGNRTCAADSLQRRPQLRSRRGRPHENPHLHPQQRTEGIPLGKQRPTAHSG